MFSNMPRKKKKGKNPFLSKPLEDAIWQNDNKPRERKMGDLTSPCWGRQDRSQQLWEQQSRLGETSSGERRASGCPLCLGPARLSSGRTRHTDPSLWSH